MAVKVPEQIDWTTVPVMEDVPRFVAGGKAWAVKEIVIVSAIGEWEEVTIVGVRPSNKVPGVFEMVEVRGTSPRRDLGRDMTYGASDWNWPRGDAAEQSPADVVQE